MHVPFIEMAFYGKRVFDHQKMFPLDENFPYRAFPFTEGSLYLALPSDRLNLCQYAFRFAECVIFIVINISLYKEYP